MSEQGPPPPGGWDPPGGQQPPPPGQPGPWDPGGYPPPPPYGYGYGYPYGPAATEGTAVAALILSIASFVACPVLPAIVALVMASGARKKIQASRGALTGEGLLTAAVIISWVNIGLAVAGIVLLVVVAALESGNESDFRPQFELLRTFYL